MKWMLLFLILLVSCAQPVEDAKPVEEKIVEKIVVQCWDNSTAASVDKCPKRPEPVEELDAKIGGPETDENESVVIIPEEPIGRQLLDEAKSMFNGYGYRIEGAFVWVVGDIRRIQYSSISPGEALTDVYLNTTSKTAVGYCNIDREAEMMGGDLDFDRRRCSGEYDAQIPLNFDDYAVVTPVDWFEKFADRTPVRVDNALLTVGGSSGAKTVQPSLHYDDNGKEIILRISNRYKLPLKIESPGEKPIDFSDAFYDTAVIEGKSYKINKNLVTYQPVSEYWKRVP